MLFVFNPKAGKGKIKTHLLDIIDIFNKNDYEVIIRSTQKAKDAYEQAREYADEVDLIVCSGGDGTLDEVVTGIMEKKVMSPSGISLPAVPMICQQPVYAEEYDRGRFHDHGGRTVSLRYRKV